MTARSWQAGREAARDEPGCWCRRAGGRGTGKYWSASGRFPCFSACCDSLRKTAGSAKAMYAIERGPNQERYDDQAGQRAIQRRFRGGRVRGGPSWAAGAAGWETSGPGSGPAVRCSLRRARPRRVPMPSLLHHFMSCGLLHFSLASGGRTCRERAPAHDPGHAAINRQMTTAAIPSGQVEPRQGRTAGRLNPLRRGFASGNRPASPGRSSGTPGRCGRAGVDLRHVDVGRDRDVEVRWPVGAPLVGPGILRQIPEAATTVGKVLTRSCGDPFS